jgi:uncharacterized membrane protein
MILKIALFLHILSAIFWIGGMLFLTAVIAPFLSTIKDPQEKSKIYQWVGARLRLFGWIAIILLLATGPTILYLLYNVPPQEIFRAPFHLSPPGRALGFKLLFVIIIVISSLVHDFWLGPKARSSPRFSFYAKVFGRGNLIIALIIVIFAVILRSGGM